MLLGYHVEPMKVYHLNGKGEVPFKWYISIGLIAYHQSIGGTTYLIYTR